MPNWVFNTLTITGDQSIRDKLVEDMRYEGEWTDGRGTLHKEEFPFSFQRIIPRPKDLDIESSFNTTPELKKKYEENIKKYVVKDWYDFGYERWGTKWDACEPSIVLNDYDCVQYTFETAWNFPAPIARELSKMYPELEFEWISEEESGDFNFRVIYKDGEVIKYHKIINREDEDGEVVFDHEEECPPAEFYQE